MSFVTKYKALRRSLKLRAKHATRGGFVSGRLTLWCCGGLGKKRGGLRVLDPDSRRRNKHSSVPVGDGAWTTGLSSVTRSGASVRHSRFSTDQNSTVPLKKNKHLFGKEVDGNPSRSVGNCRKYVKASTW